VCIENRRSIHNVERIDIGIETKKCSSVFAGWKVAMQRVAFCFES
jgi:hypothetical protein